MNFAAPNKPYSPHPAPAHVLWQFEPESYDRIFTHVLFDTIEPPKLGVGRIVTDYMNDTSDEPEFVLDRTAASLAQSASCDASRVKRYRAAMYGKEPQTSKQIASRITIKKRGQKAPLTGDGARSSLLRLIASGHVRRFNVGRIVFYQWADAA